MGLLAGGVAHDFNNLLTGVMGNAGLALQLLDSPQRMRPVLSELVRASERAAELTHQLLAYAGRGRFAFQLLDLSSRVREIVDLIQSSIPKRARLRLELGGALPQVSGDSGQLQQLVMNLVINAGEAIPEGRQGEVRVVTRLTEVSSGEAFGWLFITGAPLPGRYVELEVSDDGAGMDETTRSRIFDPFFTTKFEGRGLGLAAALGIVRGHRGSIAIQSEPEGGTVFRVLLPAAADARADAAVREAPPELRGEGTILIVDDEEAVRSFARAALEHYGYEVLAAEEGREALALFQPNAARVKLVLLDLTMPGMSGAETLTALRAIRSDLPVLATSGYSVGKARFELERQGISGFIQKPFSPAQLALAVQASSAPRS